MQKRNSALVIIIRIDINSISLSRYRS